MVTVRFESYDPLFRRKHIVLLERDFPSRTDAQNALGAMALAWDIPTDCRVVMYDKIKTIEEELGIKEE